MEIAPIPGIRAMQSVKAPRGDLRLEEIFEIESSARAGDDQAQRQGRKAAGAEEDEEDDLMVDAEGDGEPPSIDYFA